MFNEIIDECKQLVREVLSFHVLCTFLKHQIVDINIQGLPNAKNSVRCTEFPMCSKFHFSHWEIIILINWVLGKVCMFVCVCVCMCNWDKRSLNKWNHGEIIEIYGYW